MPFLASTLALASLSALSVVAGETPADDVSPTLETIVVTGVMPGPGLWRVENGSRSLWILGTVSPLPRDMKWEALQVGEILEQADAVLSPAGAEADLSAGDVMKMMTLARSAKAATKLPDRGTLADILPAEAHARWLSLKRQYLPDDRKLERQRPMFASQTLYYRAIEAQGLTRTNVVWNVVSARADELGVPVIDTKVRLPLEMDRARYKAGIRDLSKSQIDDVTCFMVTINTLSEDLEAMKMGANAWATGDLDRLLQLRHAEIKPACKAVYDDAMGFQAKPEWDKAARNAWLEAADAALGEYEVALAVLPMGDLTGPSSVLAALQARGYTVDSPDVDSDFPDSESLPPGSQDAAPGIEE